MCPTLVVDHLMGRSSPAFRELSPVAVANSKPNILPNLLENDAIVFGEILNDDTSILLNPEMVWEWQPTHECSTIKRKMKSMPL
jgi:hypothetical protein